MSSQAPANHPDSAADQDAVSEVTEARQAIQKAYEGFNRMNPVSSDFALTAGRPLLGGPVVDGPLAKVQEILRLPIVQANVPSNLQDYLGKVAEPSVQAKLGAFIKHPQSQNLMYTELGFIIVYLILRAWRMSTIATFIQRLIWGAVYSIAYLAVALLGLPTYFWGRSYFDFILSLF